MVADGSGRARADAASPSLEDHRDAYAMLDDMGTAKPASPPVGSSDAIRASAALADVDFDDVWVQPEVYVTTRHFRANRSVIGRLPPAAKDALATGGVCHYLVVYRSERGELYQFDFGPFGGDVHSRLLDDTDASNDAAGSGGKPPAKKDRDSTPGHVRENLLHAFPGGGTYLVGQTSMTLEDVRAFNATRDTTYNVNKNDCRHYVNALCAAATGVESVCSKYVRGEVWGKKILSPVSLYRGDGAGDAASHRDDPNETKEAERRRKARELAVLLPILAVTDLENVPIWDRVGQAWTAALIVGLGVRLAPPALAALATTRAAQATGAGMQTAQKAGLNVGAGLAGLGVAAEASGLLVRAAAVTQPLVAPLARRGITAAAAAVGAARGDVEAHARRGRDRAARALASFRASLMRDGNNAGEVSRVGRAAAPATVMGWAGRKTLSASASSGGGGRVR